MARFAVSSIAVPESHADLVALQRQAYLGQLTEMMAHEFNNLMTPVLARAQYAAMRDDPEAMHKALTVTVEQTQRAIAMTRCVLELGRDEALSREACHFAEQLSRAIQAHVRPFEKDGIELVIDVPSNLHVFAHPTALQHLLVNLLTRARSAMENQAGILRITATVRGTAAVIEFRDSGEPVSERVIEEIINPFLASEDESARSRAGEGIDLTLLSTRILTRALGGKLTFEAGETAGTTMRLELPVA